MSTDVRDVDRLAAIIRRADGGHRMGAERLAESLVKNGVTLPPEPQWKPGQVVRLRLEDGMPYLAKRVDSNDGWEVFGVDVVIPDNGVANVEPVVVLTAEDVHALMQVVTERRGASGSDFQWDHGILSIDGVRSSISDFFRERGLDASRGYLVPDSTNGGAGPITDSDVESVYPGDAWDGRDPDE